MNIWKLSWKNAWHKPLNMFLSLVLLTVGIAIISLLLQVTTSVSDQFEKNISGIDMVVGGKGSPLQLILASVFHVDNPTGNIPLSELEKLRKNRLIADAIPLSYGDGYRGFRIVGTEPAYWSLYQATLATGKAFAQPMEVMLGASVSKNLGLNVGDEFLSTHGLQEVGEVHEGNPFRVVGVFEPTNSVLDQLIVTSLESIWHVHEHEGDEVAESERQITSILVNFSGPMGLIRLPRTINENTNMQAAVPSFEINRLMSLLGVGVNVIGILAVLMMVVAGVSIFITLFNAMKERKYEMALMRTYGASRKQLALLVLIEGVGLVLVGFGLGILLGRLALGVFSDQLSDTFNYSIEGMLLMREEIFLLGATLLIGLLASILPAMQAARVNISQTLAEG